MKKKSRNKTDISGRRLVTGFLNAKSVDAGKIVRFCNPVTQCLTDLLFLMRLRVLSQIRNIILSTMQFMNKPLLLILLFACGQSKDKSNTAPLKISSGSATYCCDTIKTLNHTAIVQSILDTNGVLVRLEIVKVLK
jgi:hypothetical protein